MADPIDLKAFKDRKRTKVNREARERLWEDLLDLAERSAVNGRDPWFGVLMFILHFSRETKPGDLRHDESLAQAAERAASEYLERRNKALQ